MTGIKPSFEIRTSVGQRGVFQCSTRPDVFHKKNVKQSASARIWIPPIAKFGEKSALELKTIFLQYKKIL